jgi:hypothetical protein
MDNHRSPSPQQRIDRLEHRLHKLQIIAVLAVLLMVVAVGASIMANVYAGTRSHGSGQMSNVNFNTITVKRINIVAPDGTRRLVISNAADMPPPIVNGKTLKREISPAGMLFYDRQGNERGGIALARRHGGEKSNLTFDYDHAEAVSFYKQQNEKFTDAGLMVLGLPLPGKPAGYGGPARIQVRVLNGTSQIVLRDAKAKARLRFIVSKSGSPKIQFLNADGEVARELSASTNG